MLDAAFKKLPDLEPAIINNSLSESTHRLKGKHKLNQWIQPERDTGMEHVRMIYVFLRWKEVSMGNTNLNHVQDLRSDSVDCRLPVS